MLIKCLKISAIVLASLVLLLVIAINVIDPNDYKDDITASVKEKTGRELIIGGPLSFSFFDFPTIKLEAVSFSNPEWAQSPTLASMALMEADIALWPLINGDVEIRQFKLIEPILNLETNRDGVHSWTLPAKPEDADEEVDDEPKAAPMISLDNISIEKAQIVYVDGLNAQTHELTINEFRIDQTSASRLQIQADGTYQQERFKLSFTTAQVSDWLRDADIPMDVNVEVGRHTQLKMNGDITTPLSAPQIELFIDGNLDDLQALSAVSSSDLPALPPITINAVLDASTQSATLKQIGLQLGDDQIQGELSADWSQAKPNISIRLGADQFDLATLLTQLSPADENEPVDNSSEVTNDAEPETALPFSALQSLDAKIDMNIGELIMPDMSLTNLQLSSDLNDGVFNIAPLSFGLAGGEVKSTLAIDANPEQPELNALVDITQAHLSALPQLSQYLAGGLMDMSITLSTKGDMASALQEQAQLSLTVIADETAISPAIQEDSPAFATFEQADIAISLNNTAKVVTIDKLHVDQAMVQAFMDASGHANWQFGDNSEAKDTPEAPTPISEPENETDNAYNIVLGDIALHAAQLQYVDEQNEQQHAVDIAHLTLNGAEEQLNISTQLNYQNTDISLEGQTSRLATWLADETVNVDLTLTAAEQSLKLDGDITAPLSEQTVDLNINANVPELAALSELASTALPELAPLTLSSAVTRNGSSLNVRKLALTHGISDISGDIALNWSEDTPLLKANLSASLIDLTELPESTNEEQETPPSEKLFSASPLPFDVLWQGQGDIKLSVDKLNTGAVEITKALVTAKLDNGQLTLKPLFASLADGQMTGQLSLDAQGDTGKLDIDISLLDLNPQKIANLSEYVVEGAQTDAYIKLSGNGESIAGIMATSNGKLTMQAKAGKLNVDGGFLTSDLATALIPTGGGDNGMALECGVINYTIEEGLAVADKGIAFVTDQMNIVGSSEINLETEALDVNLKPRVREGLGISIADLADLVSIGGTLKNPSMGADLLSTLGTGLKVQSAIATGGLSLLASGLLEQLTADTDPCATALGIKKAPEPEPPTQVDQELPSSP